MWGPLHQFSTLEVDGSSREPGPSTNDSGRKGKPGLDALNSHWKANCEIGVKTAAGQYNPKRES